MISVHLSNLSFHAFHGVYEEETKLGNNFEVNVLLKYDESGLAMDNLNALVNYEVVFEIVKKRMAIPSPLLEEVAEAMVRKIKHQYKQLKEISVSINKLQPPIVGLHGSVGITLHKIFED
jgi:dihydroneopterin aldolase